MEQYNAQNFPTLPGNGIITEVTGEALKNKGIRRSPFTMFIGDVLVFNFVNAQGKVPVLERPIEGTQNVMTLLPCTRVHNGVSKPYYVTTNQLMGQDKDRHYVNSWAEKLYNDCGNEAETLRDMLLDKSIKVIDLKSIQRQRFGTTDIDTIKVPAFEWA